MNDSKSSKENSSLVYIIFLFYYTCKNTMSSEPMDVDVECVS